MGDVTPAVQAFAVVVEEDHTGLESLRTRVSDLEAQNSLQQEEIDTLNTEVAALKSA
jgi:hypothetical protein